MIGPALERDAVDPYALSHAPQPTAEPLLHKLAAGFILFLFGLAFAWVAAS